MRIVVYEEFPLDENLDNLTSIDFPVDVVLASTGLERFLDLKREVEEANELVGKVGYWPTLSVEDGYWFSPFSKAEAVQKIIDELKSRSSQEPLWLKWMLNCP